MNAREYYRRKSKKFQEYSESLVDSSSIGDLAFLLLIFFIVTSSFILRQGLFLSLPPENATSKKTEPDRILTVVPQVKGFLFEGSLLDGEKLAEELKARRAKIDDPVAVIQMQSGVPYEKLVQALSVVKESKIRKVSLKQDIK